MTFQSEQTVCKDKYRLQKLLGKGAYGEVWLADELTSHSHKALKIAHRQDAEAMRRFTQERELSSKLDHPNLVATHTVEQDGEAFFMVMPYMAGGNLTQKLARQGALPLLEAVMIAAQVAAGLGHLHQRDWVHRDVHPGNILFNGEGIARLSDFGLVQTPDTGTSLWYGQQLERHPGNVYYQPPEAFGMDGRSLTPLYPRADVFMLGAVLWEMVTGKGYYHHKEEPLHHLRPDTPDWLADLLAQCLATESDKRPFDGATLAQLLTMGAEGLAKMDAREAAQAHQRQQARAQQTLVQQVQTAIQKQEWSVAEKLISELKTQGNHTELAVTLLQEQLQARSTEQVVTQIKEHLINDPNTSLSYITELEQRFPDYPELPRLKQIVKNKLVEQVTGVTPLQAFSLRTWGILLWWLLANPVAYQRYHKHFGKDSLTQAGLWLASVLTHLPLLLIWLWKVAQPLSPQAAQSITWLTTNWGWGVLVIGISWLLMSKHVDAFFVVISVLFLSYGMTDIVDIEKIIVPGGATVVAFVIAGGIAIGITSLLPSRSRHYIGDSKDVDVLDEIPAIVLVSMLIAAFVMGMGANFFETSFIGVIRTLVVLIVAAFFIFVAVATIVQNIKNGRSSPWAFWLLAAAYAVMLWQVVAAWLS